MRHPVHQEILRMHTLFEQWYQGKIKKDRVNFNQEIKDYLDEEFTIVFPDGSSNSKQKLCSAIFKDHGTDPSFSITIKKMKLKALSKTLYLARYEEWQRWEEGRKKVSKGMSSASILKIVSKSKVKWIHIHETPLPNKQ